MNLEKLLKTAKLWALGFSLLLSSCEHPAFAQVGPGGLTPRSCIKFTDGSNTVGCATNLTVTGGTIGGSNPNATLTVTGGGGGGSATPGGAQHDVQFYDVQGTLVSFGGNGGFIYTGTSSTVGNVGIGSTSPGTALDVNGTARMTGFNLSGSTGAGYILTDVSGNNQGAWTAPAVSSQWTGTNPIYFNGNVGIYSAIPGEQLDIQGTVRAVRVLGIQAADVPTLNQNTTGNAATATALAANGTTCSAGNYPLGVNASGNAVSCTAANLGTVTSIATTAPITGGTITGSGTIACNVASGSQAGCLSSTDWNTFNGKGAGTVTSSGSPVNHNIAEFSTATNIIPANATDVIALWSTCSGTQYLGADGSCHNAAGGSGTVNSGTLNQFAFYSATGTAVNGTTHLIQDNNGNIGVNLASPGVALDVNGSLRGTGLDVNGTASITGNISTNITTSHVVVTDSSGKLTAASNVTDTAYSTQTFGTLTNTDWCNTNGTSISCTQAIPAPATSGSTVLQGNGAGGFTNVSLGAENVLGLNSSNQLVAGSGYISTLSPITLASPNVGIGSTVPGSVLDINGTTRHFGYVGINTTPTMYLDVNGSIRGTQIVDTGVTSAVLVANASHQVVAASNLTDTAYSTQTFGTLTNPDWCTTNGTSISCNTAPPILTLSPITLASPNVGIGSATPGQTLDVQGSIRAFSAGNTLDVQGTVRTQGFTLTGNNAAQGYILEATNSTGIGTWVPAPSAGGSGTVNSGTATYAAYYASSTTAVNATAGLQFSGLNLLIPNGNVGINSSLPGQQLDVVGTVRSVVLTTNGGTTNSYVNSTGGNFGIGSSNPGQVLDVQGSVRFNIDKSTTGVRYLCIGTDGTVESQAAACVGT